MRIVSSDFSRRLCAFSVLSARILNATVASGTRSAITLLTPSFLSACRPVVPVRRQIVPVLPDRDDRIEESAEGFDDAHQAFDVRLRGITLVGCRLDTIDWQRYEQQRRPTERSL